MCFSSNALKSCDLLMKCSFRVLNFLNYIFAAMKYNCWCCNKLSYKNLSSERSWDFIFNPSSFNSVFFLEVQTKQRENLKPTSIPTMCMTYHVRTLFLLTLMLNHQTHSYIIQASFYTNNISQFTTLKWHFDIMPFLG